MTALKGFPLDASLGKRLLSLTTVKTFIWKLKGHLCCFGEEIKKEDFRIYSINEVTVQI